jgi:hypothetical protein
VPGGWLAGEQEGTDFAFVYLAQPIGEQVGWMDVTGLSEAELSAYRAGEGPTSCRRATAMTSRA